MQREDALVALRALLPALRRDYGVRRVALFGSTARGEARDDSDLDLLVDFETTPALDVFVGLKYFLEERFGHSVDLVMREALKPRIRSRVLREAVDVG
jgi:predicted nucleotidyltransferase